MLSFYVYQSKASKKIHNTSKLAKLSNISGVNPFTARAEQAKIQPNSIAEIQWCFAKYKARKKPASLAG